MLAQYLCLWLGLRAVFQKTGQPPRTGAAAGLLALYLALVVMALLAPKAGTLVYGGMAVGYETEFARLEEISYGPVDCSLGSSNHGVIRAEFSLPKNGYGMRGYMAYDLIQDGDDWVNFNMGVNYTRTINPWVYPWQSPLDYRRPWGVNDGRLFRDAPYTGEFSMNNPKNPAWQALIPKEN